MIGLTHWCVEVLLQSLLSNFPTDLTMSYFTICLVNKNKEVIYSTNESIEVLFFSLWIKGKNKS